MPTTAPNPPIRPTRPTAPETRRPAAEHLRPCVIAAAAVLASLLPPATSLPAFRINTTPSLPRGLYLLAPLPPRTSAAPRTDTDFSLRPGDLVLACPPPAAAALALARHYLAPGPCPGGTKPIGKLVLAAAGDRLTVTADAITLNHCRLPASASRASDSRGRPLPRGSQGITLIPPGHVFLFSPHPYSFDSRYFGAVPGAAVLGRLRPLLVLPDPTLHLASWPALLRSCTPVTPVTLATPVAPATPLPTHRQPHLPTLSTLPPL